MPEHSMSNACYHGTPAYEDPLQPQRVTKREIRERFLWQCPVCRRWFSFLGYTKQGYDRTHSDV